MGLAPGGTGGAEADTADTEVGRGARGDTGTEITTEEEIGGDGVGDDGPGGDGVGGRGVRYGAWAGFCSAVGPRVLVLSPGRLVEVGVLLAGLFITLLSAGLVLLNAVLRTSREARATLTLLVRQRSTWSSCLPRHARGIAPPPADDWGPRAALSAARAR